MTDICNFCFQTGIKMGEGGQSFVYKDKEDENILIRTIPIPKNWINIRNEILVTDLTNKICPNFPKTYKFTKCNKNNLVHQIIEKFDGDISKIFKTEILNDNVCFLQILIAIYCLMKKGLRHNDIKEQNILFKKFDDYLIINYKLNNKIFTIKTKIFLVLTDFGKTIIYPELKVKFETVPCMNMRDTLSLLKLFNKKYEKYLCENISYKEGFEITKQILLENLAPYENNFSSFYDLDSELPEFNSKGFSKCFYEKLIELYELI